MPDIWAAADLPVVTPGETAATQMLSQVKLTR